ncbi:unnamed protein product [Prunus armeniaca]|uniref:Uncharacterized protein n=1 Tax=Prunus armeniaca TaxID=36596 RepID=A0A6J5UWL9_PRUAR|nr:unnamed protein product [Prunus armeniaca]
MGNPHQFIILFHRWTLCHGSSDNLDSICHINGVRKIGLGWGTTPRLLKKLNLPVLEIKGKDCVPLSKDLVGKGEKSTFLSEFVWGRELLGEAPHTNQTMLYEGLKDLSMGSKLQNPNFHIDISIEGVMLRVADVYLRLPEQGVDKSGVLHVNTDHIGEGKFYIAIFLSIWYNEWLNAISCVWMAEDAQGMFRGSSPASDPTFMVVEFVRDHFKEGLRTRIKLLAC